MDVDFHSKTGFSLGEAKLLTLFALMISFYWDDIRKLSYTMMVGNEAYGPLLLIAIAIAGAYIIDKRRITGQIIDLEKPNKRIGIALLMASIITYVIGSYSDASLLLHISSLVLFILSYLLIRMNPLILEIYLPPLALISLLALGGSSQLALSLTVALASGMLASYVFLTARITFIKKLILTIINMALYSFLKLYFDVVSPSNSFFVVVALSYSEVVISLMARRLLKLLPKEPKGQEFSKPCEVCSSAVEMNEFCPYCGRNLMFKTPPKRIEFFGLVLVPILLISLTLTYIPILTFADGSLSTVYLKTGGPLREEISFMSQGWLLYSKTRLIGLEKGYGEDFILKEVLVPGAFPETKNYTVIVELTPTDAIIADNWRHRPWKIDDTKQMYLGGSIPVTYLKVSSGNASLRVLTWSEKAMVLIDGKYIPRTIAISLFTNGTSNPELNPQYYELSEDTAFMVDAEGISGATIDKISVSGSWNQVLSSLGTFLALTNEIVIVAIAAAIVASLIFAERDFPETYLLDFIPKESLNILLEIDHLVKFGIPATSKNIFERIKDEDNALDQQRLLWELDRLENMRLIKRTLRMRMEIAILEWRLTF